MPKSTFDKINDKINMLISKKDKKIETVKSLNNEIKQIDAELKKLNEAKATLEKAEQTANSLLNL